jgi:protein PsiE
MSKDVRTLSSRLVQISENVILLVIGLATLFASGVEVKRLFDTATVNLSDLFLLFIYAEVLGMVGAFYKSHRIPITLPIIIAMTALCRMIILQSKDIDPVNILYEAGGILILAAAALMMSYKDKMSLAKERMREEAESVSADTGLARTKIGLANQD